MPALVTAFLTTFSCAHALSFALGPEVINAYPDGGKSVYQFPDAAIALLPDVVSGGSDSMLFYSDGSTWRVSGAPSPGEFPHNAPSPPTPVLTVGPPGSYDANGNWFLHVSRISGSQLVGFTHVENHGWACNDSGYGEWNAGAVVSSQDDGRTWTRDGLAIHDPQPCNATFGGAGYSSIIPSRSGSGFRAYGGCTAFESRSAVGAPGSWMRWKSGSFSSPGINGSSDCLPGIPSNTCCPIVSWNTGLRLFICVFTLWGHGTELFITTSPDGLSWGPSQVLLTVDAPRSIAYGQIVSRNSSSEAGLDAVLVYAAAPPTSGHPRDFVSRSITLAP